MGGDGRNSGSNFVQYICILCVRNIEQTLIFKLQSFFASVSISQSICDEVLGVRNVYEGWMLADGKGMIFPPKMLLNYLDEFADTLTLFIQ